MPTERWDHEVTLKLDAYRSVQVERSSLGTRRAIPIGDWQSLQGRGSMPRLALIDLAETLEHLAQRIRDQTK